MSDALYVYGIVKSGFNLRWKGLGLNGENVYTFKEGDFTALVHDCEEKPYISEDPNKIKELIITHNMILDKEMKNNGGIIPFPLNTIIKKGENSPQYNLKKWLNDNKERLERVWDKIKGKKEYGIRIYYNKNRLIQEASRNGKIKEIEEIRQGKGQGLSYLLQGKIKSEINELTQNKINQFKQKFYNDIKEITEDVIINTARISIEEERDLLLNLSVLIKEEQIEKIKEILENKNFSFHIAGPFAPYSFVENET